MIIVKPSVEIVNPIPYETMLDTVEHAIRNCYQSFDKIKEGSAENIIRGIIKSGHDAMIEFSDITVKLETDRAVLAQLSRHRLLSLAVQSQRYVNYSKQKFGEEIRVVIPQGLNDESYERLYPNAPRRRQDRKPLYVENSAYYITDAETLRETKSVLGTRINGFIISEREAVDINEPLDILKVEAILRENNLKGIR